MQRRPPIAKNLVRNSIAAIFAAIEIHNKPIFSYRYEVVVLLFINAWELLLKAYIYKYKPSKYQNQMILNEIDLSVFRVNS